jgi:hypothetical protein
MMVLIDIAPAPRGVVGDRARTFVTGRPATSAHQGAMIPLARSRPILPGCRSIILNSRS